MTNVEFKPVPDVLPEEWVQRAKKLSTTLLSDVVDTPPEMDYRIKPCNIDSVIVGSAVTVDVNDGDNLAVHHAMYQAQPGHVLLFRRVDMKKELFRHAVQSTLIRRP